MESRLPGESILTDPVMLQVFAKLSEPLVIMELASLVTIGVILL
jgi:hypothetical protein